MHDKPAKRPIIGIPLFYHVELRDFTYTGQMTSFYLVYFFNN